MLLQAVSQDGELMAKWYIFSSYQLIWGGVGNGNSNEGFLGFDLMNKVISWHIKHLFGLLDYAGT